MKFSEFVDHEDAKLSLILNAIDPKCGGVIFVGDRGSGKSTLARLFKALIPNLPFVEVPLNITEDALIGGIDVEATVKTGKRVYQRGLLSRADGGVLFIDDINLLPHYILSIILEVKNRGQILIEREGFSIKEPARFVIVATMCPTEGLISPHITDNFGMCVIFETLREPAKKLEVLKFQLGYHSDICEESLLNKIEEAKRNLEKISYSNEIRDYIIELCLKSNVAGHRGEIFLLYSARAYAAYCGDTFIKKEHVDTVLPLVLIHRQRLIEEMQKEHEHKEQKQEEKEQRKEQKKEENNRQQQQNLNQERDRQNEEDLGEFDVDFEQRENVPDEEIFQVGEPFKVKKMLFKKDRKIRVASGRRTKTKVKGRSGRYVRSLINSNIKDIAIDATIRTAAPYQKARRGQEEQNNSKLIIKEDDIRYRQREKRMGHLVIFVVDGSGSMGAQKRMIETKAAIKSLLIDCYQKRDRVSLIVFRKDKAEIVLPPTSSVQLASKKLKEIPTGGKTPLGAGLLETYKLIKNVSLKEPDTRFIVILISDGRANQSVTGLPIDEEIKKVSEFLKELPFVDFVIIDTEEKGRFITTDYALKVASYIGGDYYTVKDLKSEYITDIVKMRSDITGAFSA